MELKWDQAPQSARSGCNTVRFLLCLASDESDGPDVVP